MLRLTVLLAVTAIGAMGVPITCAPGTLSDYVNLGPDGCRLGTRVLSDFFLGPLTQGSVEIDPSAVAITPSILGPSASLLFTYNRTAANASVLESIFQATVTPDQGIPDTVSLQLIGATATGDGVVVGIVDLCTDSLVFGTCFGATQSIISSKTSLDDLTFAQAVITPALRDGAPRYDLSQDIVIDAGPNGTASLSSAQLTFTAVPEPATIVMLAGGLCALLIFRWRVTGQPFHVRR